MTTTTTFEKSIAYDRASKDYKATLDGNLIGYFGSYHAAEEALDDVAYDMLIHGDCATATELDAGAEDTPAVVPNAGIHLIRYVVVLSQPGEAFCSTVHTLCDDCHAITPGTSKMGEVINGYCDVCGIGPSVPHFVLASWSTAPTQPITIGARVEMLAYGKGTVSLITDDEHLNVQVKFDSPSRLGSKFWFDTTELHPIADPPGDNPLGDTEGDPAPPPETTPRCAACQSSDYPASAMQPAFCTECVNAMLHGLSNRFAASQVASTLQTLLDRQRARVRVNCGGEHTTWQCSEIAQRLFAPAQKEPWKDIALGRELCQMRWKNYRAFVVLIAEVASRGHLAEYAASYQAYVASFRPDTDLTVEQVLTAWGRMTDAREPRLQVAA